MASMPLSRAGAMLVVLGGLTAAPLPAADWEGWRGPGQGGVSSEVGLPDSLLEKETLRYQAPLPGRGLSGPVISRGRIFLTASSGVRGDRLHVLALDEATGKQLWERQLRATGSTQCHPKTCMAAPTPAVEGDRVYFLFASLDLACFDREGTLAWYRSLARDYPDLSNQVGIASSPVVHRGEIYMSLETDSEAFALCVSGETGRDRWRAPRAKGINWSTPLVLEGPRPLLCLQSAREVALLDLADGKTVWTEQGGFDPIASAGRIEGTLVVPGGGATAIETSSEGSGRVVWKSPKLRTSTASIVAYEGRAYGVSSSGVLTCADLKDGNVLWQERVKGPFSASPVAGDGKLYLLNEEGAAWVVSLRSEPRIKSTTSLGEAVLASPAISGGTIYVRTDRRLLAFKAPPS